MSSDSIDRQWLTDGEPQDTSKSYALSGRIMLASIIILFVIVVFLVLLHLYARWYLLRLQLRNVTRRRNNRNRSTRIIFYVDNNRLPPGPTGGLDASVIKSLPVFVYSSEMNEPGDGNNNNIQECAVCLSEFQPGEPGRILPKCKHSFHTECIDMWFFSNSTCPLCRSPVEAFEPGSSSSSSADFSFQPVRPEKPVQEGEGVSGTTSFGDRRKGIDVRIDVPNRNELSLDNELNMTSPSQGFRSPGSRLLSLKRIISMGRKSPAVSPSAGVGPSWVPVVNESDIESAVQESNSKVGS